MAKTITFIRHAESTHNAFLDPTTDPPLSEEGQRQANALTGDYELIICSTLRRARGESAWHSGIKNPLP